MSNLFTMRPSPRLLVSGPRIDTVGDSLPIPTRSMITGIIGAALGISYDQPQCFSNCRIGCGLLSLFIGRAQ